MDKMKSRSPLFYVGGKFYMANEICSLLDYERKCYIELFFGSGQVFFAKKPHKVEIINDINEDLINFYKVWRDRKDELVKELDLMPYSRKLYEELLGKWKKGDKGKDDFERAVNYFYILRNSFSGYFNTRWIVGFKKNKSKSYYNSIKLLNLMHNRIKNAQIECRDFREILDAITKEKQKDIVIYADPPYWRTEYYYAGDFSEKDHFDLGRNLNELDECKIIVSYYYNDYLVDLYPPSKWYWLKFQKTKYSEGLTKNNQKKEKQKVEELLLCNFEPRNNLNLFKEDNDD